MADNFLFYGDNLDVLRRYVRDETVDLVYLDPPFNSNADYNVLFGHADGSRAAAQIKAFEDTWRWDQAAAAAFQETVQQSGPVAQALIAFQALIGESDMLAYLSMMAPRLKELHRVLKPIGSLYLHCDPTAAHYLKLLLDAVFDPRNFRNEIIWRRTGSNSAAKRYGPLHQTIFYYRKSPKTPYYPIYGPYTVKYVEEDFDLKDDRGNFQSVALTGPGTREGDSGKPWRDYDPTSVGRHWQPASYVYTKYREIAGEDLAQYPLLERLDKLDEVGLIYWGAKGDAVPRYRYYANDAPGVMLQDIWAYQPGTEGCVYGRPTAGIDEDVKWISSKDGERLGYPTQKPLGLLARIIRSSTQEGDLVLDPFCGCGTTIVAAEQLGRKWIGIDITYLAVSLMKSRLSEIGTDDYRVIGEPTTIDDAGELAAADPYQFQWWALGLIGARPAEGKKGADKGIDGRLFFFEGQKPRQLIASVKAGKVQVSHVRDLVGVLDREKAQIGVLISFNEPTQPMRQEAASAGFYSSLGHDYPRIQLLTVAELLDGKGIAMPAGAPQVTQVALPPPPEETVHPDQMVLGD